MPYYTTVRSFHRREFGVDLVCHVKQGGYTEIVALGPFTDRASVYDNDAFGDGPTGRREFRNQLRRHARAVKRMAAEIDRPELPETLTRDMPGPLFDSMRRGHLIRCGHELDARLESTDDGEIWRIVRSCC